MNATEVAGIYLLMSKDMSEEEKKIKLARILEETWDSACAKTEAILEEKLENLRESAQRTINRMATRVPPGWRVLWGHEVVRFGDMWKSEFSPQADWEEVISSVGDMAKEWAYHFIRKIDE